MYFLLFFSCKHHHYSKQNLPKGIFKNYNVTINGKDVSNEPIGSDIKRSKEIRNFTTGQGDDYATRCLLD